MELAHFEAAVNGNVNDYPFRDINRRDMSEVFNKFSPSGNSLLHVAAGSGRVEVTRLMARHFPSLSTAKNCQDDTALHVAARAGRLSTVKVLVEEYARQSPNPSQSKSQIVMMANRRGNTALHAALVALHASMDATLTRKTGSVDQVEVVSLARFLVESAGPDVCYCQNKAGKSSFSLAVECGNQDFLEYILNAIPDPGGNQDSDLIIGKGLDCLVRLMDEKQLNLDVLRLIKEVKPRLLSLQDERGNTLLHSAASIGYVEAVCKLLEIGSDDSALQKNNEGNYAIHFACEKGYILVMKELLKKWPHPTEFLNAKGQNILHLAAQSGNDHMVRHILRIQNSDVLVNMTDHDGNTPLHLAAQHSNSLVVGSFLLDKRSRNSLKFINDQGHTAYDVVVLQYQMLAIRAHSQQYGDQIVNVNAQSSQAQAQLIRGGKEDSFETLMTLSILFVIHNIVVRRLGSLAEEYTWAVKDLRNHCRPAKEEDVNQTLNNALVVATLIIGLAFAASVQVSSSGSGDSESADDFKSNDFFHKLSQNQTKVLESWALQSFTIIDTFAIIVAVAGAFLIRLAKVSDPIFASVLVAIAATAESFALWLIIWAFLSAIFLRIQSYSVFTVSLVTLSLVLYLVIQVPFYLLMSVTSMKEGLILIFYFLLFWTRYFIYRLLSLFFYSVKALF